MRLLRGPRARQSHIVNKQVTGLTLTPSHSAAPPAGFSLLHESDAATLDSAVKVSTDVPDSLWRQLTSADPEALPYQAPEWIAAACDAANLVNVSRCYLAADGSRHVLPLVRPANLPRLTSSLSSMPPAWGMGGLISEAPPSVELVRTVMHDLQQLGYLSVNIRPNPRHAAIWAAARPQGYTARSRRAHVLDLRGGFDHVWAQRFNARTRNNISKAERSGVEVEFDTTGRLLPAFYELFEYSLLRWADAQNEPHWLARWRGHQRDPLSKLQTIAAHMGSMCRIGLARIEGRPAAAIMVLEGRNANYSRAVMNQDLVRNLGVNELLHRHAISHAIDSGCSFYHMGESGQSESLARFKEKLGAEPIDYAEYYCERWPVSRVDNAARTAVKRLIGFKDA